MMDETLIIQGCKNYEPLAQRYLYDYFANTMKWVCTRYTSNTEDAQDIMQEGFVKVFLNISKFDAKGSLEGWIKRIMINTAITYYKKNKKLSNTIKVEDDTVLLAIPNEEHYETTLWDKYLDLDKDDLTKVIKLLPENFRAVFNLFYIDNLKHKEIALLLDIDDTTCRTRLLRAKKILKKNIEDHIFSPSFK